MHALGEAELHRNRVLQHTVFQTGLEHLTLDLIPSTLRAPRFTRRGTRPRPPRASPITVKGPRPELCSKKAFLPVESWRL